MQKHRVREISKRVSFKYEVEQVRSLPEPVYDFTTLLNDYEAQNSWYHTIFLLPPTDLKGIEDIYPPSFFSNSNFYTDEVTLGKLDTLGAEHPSTLMTMHNVRSFYADEGKVEEAEVLYYTALLGKLRVLSPEYISILNTMNNIGILYRYNG
ncbi:hypothetical protein PENARI_c019G09736 [Penicillium arizonense]|uniref:Uncharacterized protein n=1 Tax=Penicillium arizonense TaxID=1835702 RepID=A0A1F5L9Q1_PENAI|nr:hypothetical protein PENARI_c019G09736 [Penicillium arizonense]OGE49958.1 hypothetical protein PENARI_c019G09736 [Penicillium arizonense]